LNLDAKGSEILEEPEQEYLVQSDVDSHAGFEPDSDSESGVDMAHGAATSAGRPIFHRAPRFKTSDESYSASSERPAYPLPDMFSPHRRGAPRYAAGGLAAELRDWLVGVKGVGSDGETGPPPLRTLKVIDTKPGPGFRMIRGQRTGGDTIRALLAGDGRLEGLAKANHITAGSIVEILPPTWETILEDGNWLVVCDWRVLDLP
jgi:hypothetical protein